MNPLQILKKVRRGLTPKKNFGGSNAGRNRPHCIIGEWDMIGSSINRESLFTLKEMRNYLDSDLTHSRALAILDAAIKRQERKLKA